MSTNTVRVLATVGYSDESANIAAEHGSDGITSIYGYRSNTPDKKLALIMFDVLSTTWSNMIGATGGKFEVSSLEADEKGTLSVAVSTECGEDRMTLTFD